MIPARAHIEQGMRFPTTDYLRALRRQLVVMERVARAMEAVDVLITPGIGSEAASRAGMTVTMNGAQHPLQLVLPRNTMIFDDIGLPALMLPSGQGESGLPVGIQIVGKPYDDAALAQHGQRLPAGDRVPSASAARNLTIDGGFWLADSSFGATNDFEKILISIWKVAVS